MPLSPARVARLPRRVALTLRTDARTLATLAALICAAAHTHPAGAQSPQTLREAEREIKRGRHDRALTTLTVAVDDSTQVTEDARQLVARSPTFRVAVESELMQRIPLSVTRDAMLATAEAARRAHWYGALSDSAVARFAARLDGAAADAAVADHIVLRQADTLTFPGLRAATAQHAMFARGLRALEDPAAPDRDTVAADVFGQVRRAGPGSAEWAAVAAALPRLALGRVALERDVAPLFPDAARAALAAGAVTVTLATDPSDRLSHSISRSQLR